MTPPPPMPGLITPLEPDRAARRTGAPAAASATQAVYADAFRRLEAAVVSSCGSCHELNEDAHSRLDGSGRMFVVADGVGGGAMAQMASRLLVARLHVAFVASVPDAHSISAAMLAADRSIAEAIARVTDRPGAATVALCAPLDRFAAKWMVAWVGDCRVYRWSPQAPDRLEPLTRDDTFANLGEEPPPGGSPGDPARMVGNGATSGASAVAQTLARGEMLALCSDGVHKHLDDEDWCRLLAQPLPLARKSEMLVALARARGSADDATVLLIERAEASWRSRRRDGAAASGSEP
jgi:serine/threonine protein phosphatase PrpC